MVLPLLLALAAAIFYGLSKVLVRKAMHTDPIISVLYTLLVAPPILTCFAIISGDFFKHEILNSWAMLNLTMAGVFYLALGRFFAFSSIRLVGAARASQLTSTQIIFAAIVGVLLLNESMSLTIAIGTLAIFLGEILILFSNLHNGESLNQTRDFEKGFVYGLVGGFLWGFSQLFTREGARGLNSSIMASFFSYLFAIMIQLTIMVCLKKGIKVPLNQLRYLLLSGVLSTLALLFQYSALQVERVIYVTPIINTSPLITLIASYLLLQRIELINKKVFLGAVIIMVGAIFITT